MTHATPENYVTPSFRVILSEAVAAKIRDGIPRASQIEAGGVMLGEHVGDNTFRVTDVSLKLGRHRYYYCDPPEHQPFVDEFLARFPDRKRFGLLGTWHSHPSGIAMPGRGDLRTLKDKMTSPLCDLSFMVMMIACLNGASQVYAGGVVLLRGESDVQMVEITIEDGQAGGKVDTL